MLEVGLAARRGDFRLQVEFSAPTPGVVALFGRSGCGKTTVTSLIAGLLQPQSGRVRLDGETLLDTAHGLSVPAEKRRIGYVFQDARLFPHFDVLGNLRYGEKRAAPGARRVELEPVVALLGLGPLLRRRPHQLSGGERQRVALGRALLAQPRLLLLDEPLASLDVARRDEVLPYLEALRDQLAIPMVYVSHQFDEVLRLATHLVLLEAGRVVAQGSVAEVSLRPELRTMVGPEGIGAVLEGRIGAVDALRGLAEVQLGAGSLQLSAAEARPGAPVRLQVLARDVILATEAPRGLSVRNALRGHIREIASDDADTHLVHVDLGGATVLARITRAATEALALGTGMPVWVLVKAVSMRGHAFASGAQPPGAAAAASAGEAS